MNMETTHTKGLIKFDRSLLELHYFKLKAITGALGGSMQVVDPDSPKGQKKMDVPFAVARKFISDTEFTRYVNPVTVAALMYNGVVCALERDIASNLLDSADSGRVWAPNIGKFIEDLDTRHAAFAQDAYFDGRYLFRISDDLMDALHSDDDARITFISKDKCFRTTDVPCIDLYYAGQALMPTVGILPDQRGVIAWHYPEREAFAVTPPIWKNVTAIGSSATVQSDGGKTEHEEFFDVTAGITQGEERVASLIDNLDKHWSLNLNFTLNSAKNISNLFGFEEVECLQLPEVMLELCTVNVPALDKSIKSTFAIGLLPSHGILWLMGLLNKCTTLEQYEVVRASIKYLTTKGMFHKKTVDYSSMFKDSTHTVPPVLDISTVEKPDASAYSSIHIID